MTSTFSDLFEDSPGEFFISVEVLIPTVVSPALPKPSIKTRKLEKRESVGDDLKVKDKVAPGEPFAQKGTSATGHWRTAICRLTEDKDRCILKVYIDESILYQSIFIHLLNQTDIRPTEHSLFYRKDCISIIPRNGQQLGPSNTTQPTHLAFPSPDTCATWQALLKSYAIPETYGRYLVPMEGGVYRLWRQVDLTIIQGRDLSLSNSETAGSNEERSEIDVFCEIHLNYTLCSRTTVQRGAELTDWHEHFSFPSLPPFDNLEIVVWKDRKSSKPINLGSTCIALCNFRRGEFIEGWFPVVRKLGTLAIENVVSELRLKIQVDEEVVLPYSCYTGLVASFQSRNFLDWISILESRLKLKDISTHLMSIAIANNNIIEQIQEYLSREVEISPSSQQTLFRGNTKLAKVVEISMTWYGMSFLEASIGPVLRRLCSEKVAIEINPARSGKGQKDADKNAEQLVYWCQQFWNQIHSVRFECPNELRRIFKTIRKVVEHRYHDSNSGDTRSYLPWQCVSAFIFLRFIVPAMLHPHLFGLYPGLLPLSMQRSLTLIAKVIQRLANLNVPSHENSMRGVEEFLKDSFHGMIDYISIVSSPVKEGITVGSDDWSRHTRRVTTDLRQRTRTMAALSRESIPALPRLLDIPRSLACISSTVVRSSNESAPTAKAPLGDDIDIAVNEFCARCFEVEEEAISRVNRIVTKVRSASTGSVRPSIPNFPRKWNDEVASSLAHDSLQGRMRPSTAPSLTDFESHHQISRSEGDDYTITDKTFFVSKNQAQRQWNIQTKSPSESLPEVGRDARTLPATPTTEKEDTSKWKKALFRGILKR